MLLLIHWSNTYLLIFYYVPDIWLHVENTKAGKQSSHSSWPHRAFSSVREVERPTKAYEDNFCEQKNRRCQWSTFALWPLLKQVTSKFISKEWGLVNQNKANCHSRNAPFQKGHRTDGHIQYVHLYKLWINASPTNRFFKNFSKPHFFKNLSMLLA